jgi:hypothetical protein
VSPLSTPSTPDPTFQEASDVANPSKAKGDWFERLMLNHWREHLGQHLTRPLPGAEHDRGDLAGIPNWTIQLKCFASIADAVGKGLKGLAVQQANGQTRYGAVVCKRRGFTRPEDQLVVMTVETFTLVLRETGWPS